MNNFCSNCGNELKKDSSFCDKCGTKINNTIKKSKKTWIPVTIIFIVFAMVFSISSNGVESIPAEPIDYKLNTPFTCNGLDVVITEVEQKNSSNSGVAKGKELIALYVSVKNNNDQDLSFNEEYIKFINDNGEIIISDDYTLNIWKGKRINNFTLQPGGTKDGYIVYSTTTINNKNLKAKVSCNDWEEEIIIDLTK